jgi:hypothetical protein
MILKSSPGFSLEQKQKIVQDWIAFIEGGFIYSNLSDALANYLGQLLWRMHGFGRGKYLSMAPRMTDKGFFWMELFDQDLPTLDRFLQHIQAIIDQPNVAERIAGYPTSADIDVCVAQALKARRDTLNRAIGGLIDGVLNGVPGSNHRDLEMNEAITKAISAAFQAPKRRPLSQPVLFDRIGRRRARYRSVIRQPIPGERGQRKTIPSASDQISRATKPIRRKGASSRDPS